MVFKGHRWGHSSLYPIIAPRWHCLVVEMEAHSIFMTCLEKVASNSQNLIYGLFYLDQHVQSIAFSI